MPRRERLKAEKKNGNGFGLTLSMAVQERAMWPTPAARDGSGGDKPKQLGGKRPSGAKRAITLPAAVHHSGMWATPTVQDSKNNAGPAQFTRGGSFAGSSLNNQVGGALNPTWVEWLMGFPEGWTDCAA
jgi:hypothetical protein